MSDDSCTKCKETDAKMEQLIELHVKIESKTLNVIDRNNELEGQVKDLCGLFEQAVGLAYQKMIRDEDLIEIKDQFRKITDCLLEQEGKGDAE